VDAPLRHRKPRADFLQGGGPEVNLILLSRPQNPGRKTPIRRRLRRWRHTAWECWPAMRRAPAGGLRAASTIPLPLSSGNATIWWWYLGLPCYLDLMTKLLE